MAWFPQDALNDGVRRREVFGWAMYDFANSGYTTVVLTAVFNAYFVGVVAANASWATLAWTSALALSSAIAAVATTQPAGDPISSFFFAPCRSAHAPRLGMVSMTMA